MVASRFSYDLLELIYGSIPKEENKPQKRPLDPLSVQRGMYCELLRHNFSELLCVWKITVPKVYTYKVDLLKLRKNKNKIY